jgi:WD40-like Beta Propeller Repeat
VKWTRWAFAAGLVVVALAGLAVYAFSDSPLADRLLGRWKPPSAPAASTSEEISRETAALRELGRHLRGRMIWASNRTGNHDVLEADLSSGRVRQLTTHAHVDTFPRYSPDGTRILFLRSKRPWVSFRELEGWDLFVMNADGRGERRLAETVYHPAWSADGKEIVFLRRNRIVAVDLARGTEREVHEGDAAPTRGSIGDPEPFAGGRFALTLRGSRGRNGVGVLTLEPPGYTPVSSNRSACQVVWTPGGALVWIESEGHGGTRVMQAARPGADPQVLIDLPGRHSHEYFPRVTPDGEWLLWGAAAEGHEHDRADYELFAWRIGSPWTTATRVTYTPANDQWPDLQPR